MKQDENSFVSRRGKRVSEASLKLDDFHIDNEPGETIDHVETPRIVPVRKQHPFVKKAIVGIALILIFLPIAIGEVITLQYKNAAGQSKQKLSQLVDSTVLPAQKKDVLHADDIGVISRQVDGLASQMCKGGLLDNIALLYPRSKDAHQTCIHSKENYSALVSSLKSYEDQQRYLEEVAASISPLTEPSTDTFAIISAQHDLWKSSLAKLETLSPPISLQSAHNELLEATRNITANWSKLNTAYYDHVASDFDEAEASLPSLYDGFRATESKFTSVIDTTQNEILIHSMQIK